MSYKEKPQIKLYKYQNSAFVLQAIIDDYAECSFENNRFQAGQFSITINYNIPNALLFERGLFIQFSNNPYAFGEIVNITDSIGADGKGSQIRIITGYDARYIFKRRIIKNLNDIDSWSMTAKGEICMRNLIQDQCGSNAETKRQLPITNVIPDPANAIGSEYSVSESFTNLYEVLTTIATQTEIGWRLNFNGSALSLEFYEGTDRHQTVRFDTDFESLSNGEFTDSSESFANSIYVCGKGEGEERDMYEGESAIEGSSPSGLERYEAYDNQSAMTTESEYEAEALAMLSQYSQTLQVSGQGLAKCPYEYGKEYDVGDIITVAFSGKSAVVQILSVTEHWTWGNYNLEFTFGKPQPDLNKQLQLILKQIQKASSKTTATASVKWYTVTNITSMQSGEVIYDTLGFTGNVGTGKTFTLYLDDEKTGSKNYNIYIRNLTGTGKLTLTTGKTGATDIQLATGDYVGRIFIDENGNIIIESLTATSTIESGSNQPVTSGGVANSLTTKCDFINRNTLSITDCNDLPEGFYCGVGLNNRPSEVGNVIWINYYTCKLDNNSNYKVQLAFSNGDALIYTRRMGGGVWQSWKRFVVGSDLDEHIGQNYCLIPNPNGSDRYTTVRFSKTNWGFTSNDLYGIVMTYYNGEEFYINARTGETHPTDPFNNRTQMAYIYGIYVDLNNGLLYIKHNGYRGFFIRFQGNLISVEASTTAPTGITFNSIVFSPNTTTRGTKGGDEETDEEKPIEEEPKEEER